MSFWFGSLIVLGVIHVLIFLRHHNRNTLVIEYCGEVITKAMFHKRIREYEEEGAKHFYFMQLKSNEVGTSIYE